MPSRFFINLSFPSRLLMAVSILLLVCEAVQYNWHMNPLHLHGLDPTIHQRSLHRSPRSSGYDYCQNRYLNTTDTCNYTVDFDHPDDDVYTDEILSKMNSYFDRLCVPQCLENYIEYDRCIVDQYDLSYESSSFYYNYLCAKPLEDDDYCVTSEFRNFDELIKLVDIVSCFSFSADFTYTYPVNCSLNSTCDSLVSSVISIMGCCTHPYVINITNTCEAEPPMECPYSSSASQFLLSPFVVVFGILCVVLLHI